MPCEIAWFVNFFFQFVSPAVAHVTCSLWFYLLPAVWFVALYKWLSLGYLKGWVVMSGTMFGKSSVIFHPINSWGWAVYCGGRVFFIDTQLLWWDHFFLVNCVISSSNACVCPEVYILENFRSPAFKFCLLNHGDNILKKVEY